MLDSHETVWPPSPRGLAEPRWRALWLFRGASSRGVSGGCSGYYADTCTPSLSECPHGLRPGGRQSPLHPAAPESLAGASTSASLGDAGGGGAPAGRALGLSGRVLPPGVPSLLSFPSFTEPPSGSSSRTDRWRQSLVLLPLRSDFLLTPAGRFPWTQDSALTARDKHCSAPLWFPWLPTRHSLPWCSLPCTTRRSLCFQGDFCPSVLVTLTIMCRGADFFGFFLRIAQFLKCINVCLAALGTCSACFLERFPSPVLSSPVPEAPRHTRQLCGGPAGPRRLWSPLPVWDLDGHVPLSHPSSLPCPLPSPRGRGAHHVSVGFFLLQS